MRAILMALAAGTALAGCTMDDGTAEAGIPLPTCPTDSRDWTAWVNAMPGPGSTPTLMVVGQVMVPAGASATLVAGATDRMMPPGQRFTLSLVPDPSSAGGWIEVRGEISPALPDYSKVIVGCDGVTVTTIAPVEKAV